MLVGFKHQSKDESTLGSLINPTTKSFNWYTNIGTIETKNFKGLRKELDCIQM